MNSYITWSSNGTGYTYCPPTSTTIVETGSIFLPQYTVVKRLNPHNRFTRMMVLIEEDWDSLAGYFTEEWETIVQKPRIDYSKSVLISKENIIWTQYNGTSSTSK